MFMHEQMNNANTQIGGRWSGSHLYSPSRRELIVDEDKALGQLGFVSFAKFFSRAFDGVPVLQEAGEFVGRVMNVMIPITWVRDDVRKQVMGDVINTLKRTPQMAVGAVTGFAMGGPLGAVAGAAVAGTKKGSGFKFKVIQSGIMPGMAGAGLANLGQSLQFGLEAGLEVGSTEGFAKGFSIGKSAFSIKSSALLGRTSLGKALGVVGDLTESVPSFIKTGAEVGFDVARGTGAVPGIPLSPGGALSTELFKGVVAPVTRKLMVSAAEQEFRRLQGQGRTLTQVAYNSQTGEAVYSFSGLTFEKGVEGVVRNRVTNEIEIDYAKLPEVLASTKDSRTMTEQEIQVIKNQFVKQVAPAFEADLRKNYKKTIADMYRKKFDEQLKPQLDQIKEYISRGGEWAVEGNKAQAVIERAWVNDWVPYVEADTDTATNSNLSVLLSKHADLVFVDRLRQQNGENFQARQDRIKQVKINIENVRNRFSVPARASNTSRRLSFEQARELRLNPVPLDASQPSFLASQDPNKPLITLEG